MNNFSEFIDIFTAVEKHGAVCVLESVHDMLDIGLPTVQKKARIEHIMDKKNPIYIGLSDGTKLYMTHDEYRRIEGRPERGKNMVVVMQRRSDDQSESPSIITKCIVQD